MSKLKSLIGAAALLSGIGTATVANALTWHASVIENYTGNMASAADFSANLGSSVFIGDVPRIAFNSNGGANYTIGSWLATGGFTYSGPLANDTLDNTLWLFYTNQSFGHAPTLTITHDDGIEVPYQNLLGPQYSGFTSGLTSAITETGTCTGCMGPGQVGIVYNEAAGAPGVLQVNSVPEPASWALMLVGFGTMGLAARRARTTKVALA